MTYYNGNGIGKMSLPVADHPIVDIEEPLLAPLLITLEAMVKRYQRLLAVIQQEKRLMIEGNLDDLFPCLTEKEGILGELKRLEARRINETNPLMKRFQIKGGGLMLLIDRVSICYREPLLSCYNRLRALSASVAEVNQINGLLVNRILQQVNGLLGLLTHLSTMPLTYQACGTLCRDFQNGQMLQSTGLFHTRG
jgi:flagellar biosynthesis/type III secretory pathway chaperone